MLKIIIIITFQRVPDVLIFRVLNLRFVNKDCKSFICLFNNNNNWRAGPPGHEWIPNYPSQLQIDEDKMAVKDLNEIHFHVPS